MKPTRPLRLRRDTLRILNEDQLPVVTGGGPFPVTSNLPQLVRACMPTDPSVQALVLPV